MGFARQMPLWTWWAAGIAVIVTVSAAAVLVVRQRGPVLPPGLVEKREAVARLLEEASRIEDVDIKPLVALEEKKDFKSAVALMERALLMNALHEDLNASLVSASQELARLAVGVEPDEVGAKAIEAFNTLGTLAQAEQKFFEDRRTLYETVRNYYADLAARKKPAIPANLSTLVGRVNSALAKTKELYQRFTAAAKAFDEAIKGQ